MADRLLVESRSLLDEVEKAIEGRLAVRGISAETALREKRLYFRVSIIGNCNLSCFFCHNEGGPERGRLDLDLAMRYIAAARRFGFDRVQFTGGEPLLHPRVCDFVAAAKNIVDDVGVTTNGTLLKLRCEPLVRAGVTRVHVSLQSETLEKANPVEWHVPADLAEAAKTLVSAGVVVRFNVPVARESLTKASEFLRSTRDSGWTFNLFALLPSGPDRSGPASSYLEELRQLADEANADGVARAFVRGYVEPQGIRCSTCVDKPFCTEASRSLRLGVDEVLRPCLASRAWDIENSRGTIEDRVRVATLLATDW